jgi:hypothetical protein
MVSMHVSEVPCADERAQIYTHVLRVGADKRRPAG